MNHLLPITKDKALKRDKGQTITSLEIAEMMEMEHSKLLRKLEGDDTRKGIIAILGEAQMGVTDYFIKSTYLTSQNKEMPCYLVTKMGCDFLANKFTGEKGILFTARYVKRFHEMEDALKPKIPTTYRDAVAQLLESLDREEELKAQLDTSKDWHSIKRVAALNSVSWEKIDWRKLKRIGEEMGYEVKKIFDANYGEVNTYHKTVWENIFYRLAMKAKNETAEKFQALVADEIIPSIRRTGGYIANQKNMTPAEIVANALIVANNIIEERCLSYTQN